jgi:hypothetical protein
MIVSFPISTLSCTTVNGPIETPVPIPAFGLTQLDAWIVPWRDGGSVKSTSLTASLVAN